MIQRGIGKNTVDQRRSDDHPYATIQKTKGLPADKLAPLGFSPPSGNSENAGSHSEIDNEGNGNQDGPFSIAMRERPAHSIDESLPAHQKSSNSSGDGAGNYCH